MIAPVQKPPSVVTVMAQAHGPTTRRTRAIPQVQPMPPIQAALRSQPQSASIARAATSGPIGPFSRMEAAMAAQNTQRVPALAIASSREAA